MTRAITQDEFEGAKADCIKSVAQQTLLIQKEGETVAVLLSPAEYESAREAQAILAVNTMWKFREHMQSIASREDLETLETELHELGR